MNREFLAEIQALLAARCGRDLSGYKPGSLRLGITRRLAALGLDRPAAYRPLLGIDPAEPGRLVESLAVGPTSFFRDPAAWQALARLALPSLLERHGESGQAWVAGCSTGEEAYSLAILLEEAASIREDPEKRISIHATDLDQSSLERGRAGFYPARIEEQIGPQRLERFFSRAREGYEICEALRDRVRWSRHDLLVEPPPGRFGLILCRNVLIFLKSSWKKRLLQTLHSCLVPGGQLLLGAAEGVQGAEERFVALDGPARLYRRRA